MAFAEWFRISGDEQAGAEAERLFLLACEDMRGGRGPAKFEPVRPARALGFPMITLGVAHILEDCGLGASTSAEREAAVEALMGGPVPWPSQRELSDGAAASVDRRRLRRRQRQDASNGPR